MIMEIVKISFMEQRIIIGYSKKKKKKENIRKTDTLNGVLKFYLTIYLFIQHGRASTYMPGQSFTS